MEKNELLKRKKIVDNYLKKEKYTPLMDILLDNVEENSFYIRLDYNIKYQLFKINWINLELLNNKKVKPWINSSLIYLQDVENIKDIVARNGISEDYEDKDNIKSDVTINFYVTNYEYNKNTFKFKRYIPKCWPFLVDIIHILFENMTKNMYLYFQIMVEKYVEPSVNNVFAFDLKKDDFNKLFEPLIISRGQKIFDEDKILFMEKMPDVTYAIVQDVENCLVSINYNDKNKEIQMNCNCEYPHFCKHMYATLLAIKKNKKYKKFYKISYVNNDNIIDNIKNFNYLLCVGILQDYFIIVDKYELELIPILENKKLNYKIIEDDEDHNLEIDLEKYLKKHR